MTTLKDIAEAEAEWLLEQQDDVSGGWGAQPGDDPSALNTAETVLAVLEVRGEPGEARIAKAAAFLARDQATGPNEGAWERCMPLGEETLSAPDVLRTGLACQALMKTGRAVTDPNVEAALKWLVNARNGEGLWGYGGDSATASALLPSATAVGALIDACANGDTARRPLVETALAAFVERFRRHDGSFGDVDGLRGVHTMHAVLLLQKARKCKFPTLGEDERNGIEWLLDHVDEVFRDVEETIALDPADPRINYSFVYVVESLFIKVLTDSEDGSHRESRAYREAFLAVKKRHRPEGGFYGNRVFSWSTARSITALWQARDAQAELPRWRQAANPRTPLLIGVFAIALAVVAAVLASADSFGLLVALFYVVLVLAMLLVVGALSEDGFVGLVRNALGRMTGRTRR